MDKASTRILYFGTPEISAFLLNHLLENGFNVVGLVAQIDKPVGRSKTPVAVPTKVVAQKHNIPIYQPQKIRLDYEFIKDINPDLIITFAYGQIMPQGLLDIPRLGAINFHASLLPKYRGAAPIQHALINGEEKTGITLMEMIDKMDAGRMYATIEVKIDVSDNFSSLEEKIKIAATKLADEALEDYINGKLVGVSQNEEEVTFASKILEENEKLDLSLLVDDLVNYVRALAYIPGAYLLLNNEKYKIFKIKKVNTVSNKPLGQVVELLKEGPLVQGKDGQFVILELQKSGKNKVSGKDFVNGNKNIVGQIFN